MTIMIANGASAGSLSPIAPTGVVVNGLIAKMGITNQQWPIYLNNLMIHTIVAFEGYFVFGGLTLFARRGVVAAASVAAVGVGYSGSDAENEAPFAPRHWLTHAVITALLRISRASETQRQRGHHSSL